MKKAMSIALFSGAALAMVACGGKKEQIKIDGSSTVGPISEAIAELYADVDSNVSVGVGISGTGGGFKKFCIGETDISDASRPIKEKEQKICADNGVEYIELMVAYDGLAVVAAKGNDFLKQVTVDELVKAFCNKDTVEGEKSKKCEQAQTWKDVNGAYPAEAIKIFAPGHDSGTYDYFKEAILGKKSKGLRKDASLNEDDNALVRGIAGDNNAIGFFGLAYYENNKDTLKVLPVVNPKINKAVTPSLETVKSGEYAPLSRPLFIYVSKKALAEKSHVKSFVQFYLKNAEKVSQQVGYIPLASDLYTAAETKIQ